MSKTKLSYYIFYKIIIIFVFHQEKQLMLGHIFSLISNNDLST